MVVAVKTGAKAKAKSKPATKVVDEITQKVNRVCEIDATLAPFEKLQDERKKLMDFLRGAADARPPEEAVVFEGEKGAVTFEAKTNQRVVTDRKAAYDALLKAIGPEKTFELLTFKITDLDKYLSANEQATCMESQRVGARRSKVAFK